ncbi:recombinase family protein [Salinibacillus xinjiangensis]|uniref:Recombinase family protein n=1 Tax=Salinibacillus xinjiangensis TaxID=1229268 RepID=A0A6G1X6T2_9BACI|nr:recombinase family protein [Salinibacillus xinjiangensis]MRG86713.1 recombinase family protein [Salinibacillus xinjiangensis]
MKYGFARVSTKGQATSGNSLEDQVEKLKDAGCEVVYQEAFTGTKRNRPQFNAVLSKLKNGDTLVVTKLDRFARSTVDGIQTIQELFDKGVKVHILNMGLVEDTPTGRLIFNIMSSFAEFERDMIVERTQEGKSIAKQQSDFREGRPNKFNKKQIEHALVLLNNNSYKQVEQLTGISKSTLIRAKRKQETKALK